MHAYVACAASAPHGVATTIVGLPTWALADEPFTVGIDGLPPGARVSIDVELVGLLGRTWRGSFAAVAGDDGSIDLTKAPLDGFARPDPAQLLWGLDPDDVATGERTAADVRGTITVTNAARTLARHSFARAFLAEGVREIELTHPVTGALYLPPTAGPHPAVITVSGSGGGIARHEAALLASHGFACLALAYFNVPGRPSELIDIPLEYFGAALDWLAGQPSIRGDSTAFMGRSRGGELSLQLAATFSAVRAAVAVVPSGYRWGAMTKDGREGAAWTWRGAPLPWIRGTDMDWERAVTVHGALELAPAFRAAVAHASAQELEEARIPIERANCPLLILCGAADAMWDAVQLSDVVMERATPSAGFLHGVRRAVYPDAGHALGLPYLPAVTSGRHDLTGERYAYGGTRSGTAAASVAAWREALTFLTTALARQP